MIRRSLPESWFIHPSPPPSGQEPLRLVAPYREALFGALGRRGIRFLFVGVDDSGARKILDPGLRRWSAIPARALGPYRHGVAPKIVGHAARGDYDIWIASIVNWWPTHAAFPIVRARRKPFVLWMEDWLWPQVALSAALRRYNQAILRHAGALIVAGKKAQQFAIAAGAEEGRIFIARNSTEDLGKRPWSEAGVADLRARLAAPDAEFVCLFLNRLIHVKGLDVLFRAWAAVERHSPGAYLAVVGDGPARAEWEELKVKLGLTRVRFLGAAPYRQIHLFYRVADLYVHPGRFVAGGRVRADAWGFTLNEAMSVGTPVLATEAVGAAHDLIDPGVTGSIIPPEDIEALAEALIFATENPKHLAAVGLAGRRKVQTAYDPEGQAAVFETAIISAAR